MNNSDCIYIIHYELYKSLINQLFNKRIMYKLRKNYSIIHEVFIILVDVNELVNLDKSVVNYCISQFSREI